jgi:hypothetical protein
VLDLDERQLRLLARPVTLLRLLLRVGSLLSVALLRRLAELLVAHDGELPLEIGNAPLQRLRVLTLQLEELAREVEDLLRELLILAVEFAAWRRTSTSVSRSSRLTRSAPWTRRRSCQSISCTFFIRNARDDRERCTARD